MLDPPSQSSIGKATVGGRATPPVVNAGAIWQDAPLVVDRHFVSSRKPGDLPDFMMGVLRVLSRSAKVVAR